MKKILIFSSSGGGGHISAASAIEQYLSVDYNITICFLLDELFKSVDPVRYVSGGRLNAEDFYNYCMRTKQYRTANYYHKMGWYIAKYASDMFGLTTKIYEYIRLQQPDLIISVVPLVNADILSAAQKFDIPFIIAPTDLDGSVFLCNIATPTYTKLSYLIPFDDPILRDKISINGLLSSHLSVTGFPIRNTFFQPKNHQKIKQQLHIPQHTQVVTILMGAVGSYASLEYVIALKKITLPIHLIVCIGKNSQIRTALEQTDLPAHISITIIGYTQTISDIMAVTDLLITKTGSVSICEALYMNIPVLLDQTSPGLIWEQCNVTFVKHHQLGDTITEYKQIPQKVTRFLTDTAYLQMLKKNITQLPKKHFGTQLHKLVTQKLDNHEHITPTGEQQPTI